MYAVTECPAHLKEWGKEVLTMDVSQSANIRDDAAVEEKLKKLNWWAVSDLLNNFFVDWAGGGNLLPILKEYRAPRGES